MSKRFYEKVAQCQKTTGVPLTRLAKTSFKSSSGIEPTVVCLGRQLVTATTVTLERVIRDLDQSYAD